MKKYAVATFAIGIEYIKFAITLAESYLLYNSTETFNFYIITNTHITLPHHLKEKIIIITVNDLLIGEEILLNKVFINKYINDVEILLIDADSIICKPLLPLFHLLREKNIGVWGYEKNTADNWKGDLSDILEKNSIKKLYGINGCLYYFKKNNETEKFFSLCQTIANEYDEKKLPRVYNNIKDDEIIISLACAILSYEVLPPNAQIKAEKMYYSRKHINLFIGKCEVYYNNFEFEQNNIYTDMKGYPIIFCLDRATTNQFDYKLTQKFTPIFLSSGTFGRIITTILYSIIVNCYYLIKYTKWTISNLKRFN